MSKKDNFSQAAYEMFGIGRGGRHDVDKDAVRPQPAPEKPVEDEEQEILISAPAAEPKPAAPQKPQTTILAEGSVFEGTLRTKGDVEIAGSFKGDIFSEGDVRLLSSIEGNVQGSNVELVTSGVQGDITARELLKIGPQSAVGGNIHTKDMVSSGRIVGNVEAAGRVTLTDGSGLTGDLTAAALSVMEGALIDGRIKVVKK